MYSVKILSTCFAAAFAENCSSLLVLIKVVPFGASVIFGSCLEGTAGLMRHSRGKKTAMPTSCLLDPQSSTARFELDRVARSTAGTVDSI